MSWGFDDLKLVCVQTKDEPHFNIKLVIGKIYFAYEYDHENYSVKMDGGYHYLYKKLFFTSVEKYRDQKIENLLNG